MRVRFCCHVTKTKNKKNYRPDALHIQEGIKQSLMAERRCQALSRADSHHMVTGMAERPSACSTRVMTNHANGWTTQHYT